MPTVTLSAPHDGQRKVLNERRRYNVLACGRRWGKTQLGQYLIIEKPDLPTAWFAPTYKDLFDAYDQIERMLKPAIINSNRQEKRIKLATGGIVEFWTFKDRDPARGRKYARVIVDEAAEIENLRYGWNYAIRQTLTDYEGDAYFLSTPRGRNFFYELYQRGQDPFYDTYASWSMPTVVNPHINPAEVEAARGELPEAAFRQEYLAAFLEDDGAVFRRVRNAVRPPEKQGRNVMGIDWAQSHDFTVLTVMNEYGETLEVDRFNQIGWDIQRGRVRALADKYAVKFILAEENSIGGPNIEALQNEGLPVHAFTTTNASKQNLVTQLQLALERDEVSIPDDAILIGELESYEATRLPSGKWRYEAPKGQHDDMVMSIMLAYEAVLQLDRYTIQVERNPFY